MSIKKDKYLDIPVFDGDDGIKYIRYDDLCLILNKLKANLNKKDKEIEKLTAESTEWESKYYDESKKVDKALEYLDSYNTDFKNCRFGAAPISISELGDLLDILKGEDNE